MIDESIKEQWKKAYDKLKESLQNDKVLKELTLKPVIKSLSEKTHDLSDCFNELIETCKDDGNLVPVIVGYIMAENVANKLMTSLTAGAVANMPPGAMMCMAKSIIYNDLASQLAMTLFENSQKGWIDDFLNKPDDT